MYIFDPGRSLTPEEVEVVKPLITPHEKVKSKFKDCKTNYIEAPYEGKKVRRNETMDK